MSVATELQPILAILAIEGHFVGTREQASAALLALRAVNVTGFAATRIAASVLADLASDANHRIRSEYGEDGEDGGYLADHLRDRERLVEQLRALASQERITA